MYRHSVRGKFLIIISLSKLPAKYTLLSSSGGNLESFLTPHKILITSKLGFNFYS